ncbi:hypothetical protein [Comamonas odontotermitis]|uniref:hypothetical protein n=1 Tax=Comamonas odontotermitis TaxID=379895 RepID=UPI001CC58D39|nr:hypothetical protein [Comamonas odontotermitis]UBB17772.1 hypothetical protein LAD35_03760 [Comamonas odontotermitis]
MFVFPLLTGGSFWASLKNWTFPWAGPLPDPLDQEDTLLSDQENKDHEQDQKINRDA